MSKFDISFLFNTPEIVKTVTLYSSVVNSSDERGDTDSKTEIGSDSAIVLTADGDTTWQTYGIEIERDYDVFLKDDSTLASSLQEGYYLKIDSDYYTIRKITVNPGHIELAVKK